MKKLTLAAAATVLMASPAFAGDAAAGKGKSMMCAACHGSAGISAVPMYPNLAGQKEIYLTKQLKDFKWLAILGCGCAVAILMRPVNMARIKCWPFKRVTMAAKM